MYPAIRGSLSVLTSVTPVARRRISPAYIGPIPEIRCNCSSASSGAITASSAASSRPSSAALATPCRLDKADLGIIEKRVVDLREAVERLREDLRRRIGTTRSRLALVNRFKLRCEWHDRERMLAVADDQRLPGGPEDRLTGEFARYLFDAGLSPLTKPLAGGLQPDLLDPLASFYVEAKQYSGTSARGDIVRSVAQVLDTVGRLRGGPYAVDEAFCVVFRRDGPFYDLPEVLQTETYRLHLVLVDLAPTTEAGRRERERPVQIPAQEFFAAYPESPVEELPDSD
jgi:hypothetical protein